MLIYNTKAAYKSQRIIEKRNAVLIRKNAYFCHFRVIYNAFTDMFVFQRNISGYYLEVSSPGMDRPLITEAHYQKYMGELVDVRLYKPYEGEKLLTGTLEAKTDETVSIRPEGREEVITLPLKEVAKVQLAVVL